MSCSCQSAGTSWALANPRARSRSKSCWCGGHAPAANPHHDPPLALALLHSWRPRSRASSRRSRGRCTWRWRRHRRWGAAARSGPRFGPPWVLLPAGYLFGASKIPLWGPKIGATCGSRGMFRSNERTATAGGAQVYCL
jgi:hypothetical protein